MATAEEVQKTLKLTEEDIELLDREWTKIHCDTLEIGHDPKTPTLRMKSWLWREISA